MARKALTIHDGNINNFSDFYKNFLALTFSFEDFYIDNSEVLMYYRFCIMQGYDIDEIFSALKTTQSKEDFVKYANRVIEEAKIKSLKEQIAETYLMCYLSLDNFDKNKIKQIIEYINFLRKENYTNIEISIDREEKGFNKEELLNLLELQEILQQNIYIFENNGDMHTTLNQTIDAYDKMEKEIEKIKELDLSPFEQFLYIHDFVANRIYNKEENWQADSKSRSFVNAMTSGYIVCAGYANIVRTFCERLGIECFYLEGKPQKQNVGDFAQSDEVGHAANVVKIVDKKYGINGYYFCDACWDSKESVEDTTKNYFYAALPIQDIDRVGQSEYFSHELDYMGIPKQSIPISISTFKKALISLYSKIEKEQFDKQIVYNNLKYSIQFAYEHCEIKSANAFMKTYLEQRQKQGQYTF